MAYRTSSGNSAFFGCVLKPKNGFTFIELMVVMAIIATLIAIAMPRYFEGLVRTKETALKQDLKEIRDAIDHYHTDKGEYPASLDTLVSERYLRFIPVDPVTEKTDTWQTTPAPHETSKIYDVNSGAATLAKNGTAYNTW